MRGTSRRIKFFMRSIVIAAVFLALVASTALSQSTAYASGNPPAQSHPAPSGGVNTLHGGDTGLKHGVKRVITMRRTASGALATSSNVTGTDPILMVHGYSQSSGLSCTAGMWGATKSYLQNYHAGLGSDLINWTGPLYMVGFYNGDWNCDVYLSTNNNPYGNYDEFNFDALKCNNVGEAGGGGSVQNNDYRVGTNSEPIEHISCELSWYIWDNFTQYGKNVKIVAHSMGGLITRYMIEKTSEGDSHFAPYLFISDVVTFSTPHGGINSEESGALGWGCSGGCYQSVEMLGYYPSPVSPFINDLNNHDHPNAAGGGTDWTMLGSLGIDPLDWDYQATDMSNSNGLSNNHRIGYASPVTCYGTTEYPNGYNHGDYMGDTCDAFDAHYYYCDGCSRLQHTNFSYTTGAPHSLHEMLFAFVYNNW